jgi:very-short-patch-repair endonuclease
MLGYKNSSDVVNGMVRKNDKTTFAGIKQYAKKIYKNMQNHTVYINESGVKNILKNGCTPNNKEICKVFGIKKKRRIKKEICVIECLNSFCAGAGIKGIHQYSVKNKKTTYRIDYYLPDFRIAIEIDEYGHSGYNKDKEKIRESFLKEKLECVFIRCNPDDEGFKISNLIGRIYAQMIKGIQFKFSEKKQNEISTKK